MSDGASRWNRASCFVEACEGLDYRFGSPAGKRVAAQRTGRCVREFGLRLQGAVYELSALGLKCSLQVLQPFLRRGAGSLHRHVAGRNSFQATRPASMQFLFLWMNLSTCLDSPHNDCAGFFSLRLAELDSDQSWNLELQTEELSVSFDTLR